ncbi:YlzJ-like family protein, partial [Paenibacillus polymyxa]
LLMQVQPLESRRGIIVRLLDCPLDAYLNPRYGPGQIIEWS